MKPWELVARAATPAGEELTLMCRDGEYVMFADGRSLMSSRLYNSEDALATLACARAKALPAPQLLVGGLGMGFTLRTALDALPPSATIVVAELVAAVVDWNRGPLAALAGRPLDDPRVQVEIGDVLSLLQRNPGRFDAILLDVDNGPAAFTSAANAALYEAGGVEASRQALAAGGVLAVWSANEDRAFERRLRNGRFTVKVERVRGRAGKGPRHFVFMAHAEAAARR